MNKNIIIDFNKELNTDEFKMVKGTPDWHENVEDRFFTIEDFLISLSSHSNLVNDDLNKWLTEINDKIEEIKIINRVPENAGVFFDNFKTNKAMKLLEELMITSKVLEEGVQKIEVLDMIEVKEGDKFLIFDDVNLEEIEIVSGIDGLLTIKDKLKNSYKDGAYITNSVYTIEDSKFTTGSWDKIKLTLI